MNCDSGPKSSSAEASAPWDPLCGACNYEGGGAQGRNRTTDTVIFSHVLYQLSYLGISRDERKRAYRSA